MKHEMSNRDITRALDAKDRNAAQRAADIPHYGVVR